MLLRRERWLHVIRVVIIHFLNLGANRARAKFRFVSDIIFSCSPYADQAPDPCVRQNFRKLSLEKKEHVRSFNGRSRKKCSFCETFPQDSRYELDKSGTLVFNTHRKDESRSDVSVAQ